MVPSGVLLLGEYRQTITVVRSLARAGYRVIVGAETAHPYTSYSRHRPAVWCHPDPEHSEAEFIAALVAFLGVRNDVGYVFPIGEVQLACLARHHAQIPSRVAAVMPDPSTVTVCLDKPTLYFQAAEAGVPCAPYRSVTSYDELLVALAQLGYPSVVKPPSSFVTVGGNKAVILRSPKDLSRHLAHWPKGHNGLLVQEHVDGVRHNCHFLAHEGRVFAYFEQQVLRTDRLDYTGYGVDGMSVMPAAELRECCERLLARLRYSGVGCVQFMIKALHGGVSLLEVNPRLDAACAMPYYCGYDFPLLAIQYTSYRCGESPLPLRVDTTYPTGQRGVWLLGDMAGLRKALDDGTVGWRGVSPWLIRIARSALVADFHLIWSWKDPGPALHLAAKFLWSLLLGVIRRGKQTQ